MDISDGMYNCTNVLMQDMYHNWGVDMTIGS